MCRRVEGSLHQALASHVTQIVEREENANTRAALVPSREIPGDAATALETKTVWPDARLGFFHGPTITALLDENRFSPGLEVNFQGQLHLARSAEAYLFTHRAQ